MDQARREREDAGYQFHERGEMPGFVRWLREPAIQSNPHQLVNDLDLTTRYAAEGYLGRVIAEGRRQGLTGSALATYVQRNGQRSVRPETTGRTTNGCSRRHRPRRVLVL